MKSFLIQKQYHRLVFLVNQFANIRWENWRRYLKPLMHNISKWSETL